MSSESPDSLPLPPLPDITRLITLAKHIGSLKKTVRTGWVRRNVQNPESVADHTYRMAMLALTYGPFVSKHEYYQEYPGTLKTGNTITDKSANGNNLNQCHAAESDSKEVLDSKSEEDDIDLPSNFPQNEKLDVTRCCIMCLVHDLAEGIVGDIVVEGSQECRDNISIEQKAKMEEKAIRKILLEEEFQSDLNESSNQTQSQSLPNANYLLELWYEYEHQKTPESRFVKEIDKMECLIQANEYEDEQQEENGIELDDFFESTKGKFRSKVMLAVDADLRMRKAERMKKIFKEKQLSNLEENKN